MKILVVLLAFALVAGSNYQHKLNYTNKRSLMAVMTEVETKIKSHSPLDAVLNILTQFRDAVNSEQVSHDEIYNVQVGECDSEFEFRAAEIQNAKNVLRDSSASLSVCQTSKIRATDQQQVNSQQTSTFQNHLSTVLSAAEAEQGYYSKRSRPYEDTLHSIDEAQDILHALYNGNGSFAQLNRVSKVMLQTSFQLKLTKSFAPIFYTFSELAKQGDYAFDSGLLEQAQHLLSDLRNEIQTAYDDYASSNAESVSLFNNQKDKVNKVLARLASQFDRLQNKLDHLGICISTQTAIVNTSSSKLNRNQQQLEAAQALCGTFDNEYHIATSSRRNEIQLVSQLEEMVVQRFEVVQEERVYVKDETVVVGYPRLHY